MPGWLTNIAPALIGLVGTLAVAYLGFLQWRRSRADGAASDLRQKRRQAYEALWEMVETTHLDLRTGPLALAELRARVREVNTYVLKNEIYLADGDHELVNDYLTALGEMISWAENEGDSAFRAQLEDTASIPVQATAAARAFELRDELKQKVRNALGS